MSPNQGIQIGNLFNTDDKSTHFTPSNQLIRNLSPFHGRKIAKSIIRRKISSKNHPNISYNEKPPLARYHVVSYHLSGTLSNSTLVIN